MITPGSAGVYRGTDKDGVEFRFPRHIDPVVDGTRLARHHPVLFEVDRPPDSVPLAEFDAMVEAQVPAEVLHRIDRVMAAGRLLADKGLADEPPSVEAEWRRGMILSWSHGRDLGVALDALGHPRDTAGHDTDETVLGYHLQERLEPAAAPWFQDYVSSLDPGARVNVGFFNPHISASLHRWGDARGGVQNAMEAHRLAAHHLGSTEQPLDWIERAANFVVHHIPREHWGIRHEARGDWSELEVRLSEDPAIKDATIGQVIARDAAKIYQLLEEEGRVVPWQLLAVPATKWTPSVIEHADLLVQAAQGRVPTPHRHVDDEDEAANPARVARAVRLLQEFSRSVDPQDLHTAPQLAEISARWAQRDD